ncbi:hypothetical protein BDR26DRAFT_850143 [Obelidium mucronatum]|nr:hypothetical protein BDR26DRAFT_850143 [Obelidium mucronatum]
MSQRKRKQSRSLPADAAGVPPPRRPPQGHALLAADAPLAAARCDWLLPLFGARSAAAAPDKREWRLGFSRVVEAEVRMLVRRAGLDCALLAAGLDQQSEAARMHVLRLVHCLETSKGVVDMCDVQGLTVDVVHDVLVEAVVCLLKEAGRNNDAMNVDINATRPSSLQQ